MTKTTVSRTLAVLVFTASSAFGDKPNDLDRVYEFLSEHAVNRTVQTNKNGILPPGNVGYSFTREATLCNLSRTTTSIKFDQFLVIQQENWDVVDGQKSGDSRQEDRLMVLRTVLGVRESTGAIAGVQTTITSTRIDNWAGAAKSVRMRMKGNELEVVYSTVGYDDYFAEQGSFYPGANESVEIWRVENGKLCREKRRRVFRVEPDSLQREMTSDQSADPVLEVEVSRLPLK